MPRSNFVSLNNSWYHWIHIKIGKTEWFVTISANWFSSHIIGARTVGFWFNDGLWIMLQDISYWDICSSYDLSNLLNVADDLRTVPVIRDICIPLWNWQRNHPQHLKNTNTKFMYQRIRMQSVLTNITSFKTK